MQKALHTAAIGQANARAGTGTSNGPSGRPMAVRRPVAMSAPAVPRPIPQVRKPMFGAKAVGSFVPRLTRTAFEKFGFSAATLITDWAQIVGSDLARATAPERLKWPKGPVGRGQSSDELDTGRPGATLVLRVDDGRALDIQYKTAQIISRINAYFGYRAVAEIRILQAPIERRGTPTPRLTPAEIAADIPAVVAGIESEGLRDALARMAAGLKARAAAKSHR